jgi:REP element-mobilizing transposase RayT
MARLRRKFEHGKTYHILSRTKEGLPFVPNRYIKRLIGGILARAQELYPDVTLVTIFFMSNHYHAIVTSTGDPAKISDFFGYINGELSSLFHRLTGVSNDNFWSCRFKAQILLTADSVMEKIAYSYLNPVKAYLIDKTDLWEGFSTWNQFLGGDSDFYRWATDAHVERLPKTGFTEVLIDRLCKDLEVNSRAPRELVIDCFAWKSYFPETRNLTDEFIRQKILGKVREKEREYLIERIASKKKVVGVKNLRLQNIYKNFKSKDYRRTPLAISTCNEELKSYKERYWQFCDLCRAAWQELLKGNFSVKFPPGAFIPRRYPLASGWG